VRLIRTFYISLFLTSIAIFPAFAGPPVRKIVIVSASYGAGHNSSAKSIELQMKKEFPGAQVTILQTEDYMRFGYGEKSKEAFDKLYQKNPELYDKVFQMTMWSARNKKSAADIPQVVFKRSELLRDLIKEQPDLVYSTHHISTSMLIKLREEGAIGPENFKIGWVDTDFVHEPFFYLNSLGIEKTFMAHPFLTEARIAIGIPKGKMATTGLPISPVVFENFTPEDRMKFLAGALETPNRSVKFVRLPNGQKSTHLIEASGLPIETAEEWSWVNGKMHSPSDHPIHLDPEAFMVTIASGGAGLGDYPVIADSIIQEARKNGKTKIQIVAVCGANEKNYTGMIEYYTKAAAAGKMEGVTFAVAHGVDNSKLMRLVRSSDVFVGKSGSQSPIEAAIMGVKSILLDVLGGQEHHTASFFGDADMAVIVGKKKQGTVGKVMFELLNDPVKIEKMEKAQAITRKAYNMDPIREFAQEAFEELDRVGKVPLTASRKGRTFNALSESCRSLISPIPN
jgi:UDP-N-acetylglucosamine:LPS N-acetylglucosamine transferase